MNAYRFKYRLADASSFGPWNVQPGLTAPHSEAVAAELVAQWNRRDRGRRIWTAELCIPDSFDYPAALREIAARKIPQCYIGFAGMPPLPA